jgi:cation:H+ antiporter
VTSFSIYILRILGEKEYFTKIINELKQNHENVYAKILRALWRFGLGVVILIASSFFLVYSGKIIAQGFGIGLVLFGIIFIALGTALPELSFGIKASLMDHKQMTLGNSLGSIAFNASFILGVMALIRPIHFLPGFNFMAAVVFLFIAFLIFNFFAYSHSLISRREGIILVLIYAAFLTVQYLI